MKITYEDYKDFKWLSIYGAYVAIQCHQHLEDGKGLVLSEDMERIKKEAMAIADLESEGDAL